MTSQHHCCLEQGQIQLTRHLAILEEPSSTQSFQAVEKVVMIHFSNFPSAPVLRDAKMNELAKDSLSGIKL